MSCVMLWCPKKSDRKMDCMRKIAAMRKILREGWFMLKVMVCCMATELLDAVGTALA